MNSAIVQHAIAFVNNLYGLEEASIAARVDAKRAGGCLVTVWIGINLYQRVFVALDGTVRPMSAAGDNPALE